MHKKVEKVEDLEVFKKAHFLALKIYKVTERYPLDEKFGLISQMRRASSSICANLMEGGYRLNKKEFRQFVGIAKGSIGELKYHLLLSRDLGYLTDSEYNFINEEVEEISRMLNGLVKALK